MAIAIRSDSLVAPTITQQNLYDGIKQAFVNAGLNTFDEYVSGTDRIVVYGFVQDTTKTYGTTYLRIRVTTGLAVFQQLYSTWSTTNRTGANPSTELSYTALAGNVQINFVALNGSSEYRLVIVTQGTTALVLGCVSPANRPDWWDLNAWNYAFIPTTSTFAICRSTALNPYGNSDHDASLNLVRMATANVQTNRRDLLPGIVFYSHTNQGISGRTSDDWVSLAGSGTTRYDIVQIPNDTKQYLLLNPSSGGLAVRIA